MKKVLTTAVAALAITAAPLTFSHLNDKEPMQSYRQSFFTLLAMNFGPIGAMLKGELPWDEEKMLVFAEDFTKLASMDVTRAFAPGTDGGTTRAKPAIWENMEDFKAKYAKLQEAAPALLPAVKSGDKAAIGGAMRSIGGTCKGCHDEYKSKDYL